MNKFFIFLTIIILILVGLVVRFLPINKIMISLDKNYQESQSFYSDNVVCTLKISAVTKLEDGHIEGSITKDNMTLTFVDLNTNFPSMVGNLGDKAPLAKIDNGSIVYLVEQTGPGNINIFTLFRDKNVMTLSKQYELLGKPFGMIMMGDCLSGV